MVSLIAAMDDRHLIGVREDGVDRMPWPYLEEDLAHFKKTTKDHQMVMGSTTLLSLPGMLPGREHRVLTRDEDVVLDRIARHPRATSFLKAHESQRLTFHSGLDDALACENPIVTGGAAVYAQALERDRINKLYLTHVHEAYDANPNVSGTVYMPSIDLSRWFLVGDEDFLPTNERPGFTIATYKR